MNCAFCGYEYDAGLREACPTCPLASHCGRVCCPRCGYEAVRLSPLIGRLSRWLARTAPVRDPTADRALIDMALGQEARVRGLAAGGSRHSARLLAMGIVPGVSIRLLRRSPAYVFSVGNSQFAVDERLAAQILVHSDEAMDR